VTYGIVRNRNRIRQYLGADKNTTGNQMKSNTERMKLLESAS